MKKRDRDKADEVLATSSRTKSINMTIDGESFSLNVEPSTELAYRLSAGTFNRAIDTYRSAFPPETPGISGGLYRLMAGLEMAFLYEEEKKLRDSKPVEQRLEALCERVELFLEEQEQDEFWQKVSRDTFTKRK
ncbi:cell division protein ZapA [Porphyromonas circumdentaria]|uniref:cell division protein ZapA n=1 Tax=Porphyromonas circumdentaria TaxID=29524 RepID=UPI0026DB5D51|nr:cell division protein ZapA [Porphyromonas circumdentaria]